MNIEKEIEELAEEMLDNYYIVSEENGLIEVSTPNVSYICNSETFEELKEIFTDKEMEQKNHIALLGSGIYLPTELLEKIKSLGNIEGVKEESLSEEELIMSKLNSIPVITDLDKLFELEEKQSWKKKKWFDKFI